MSKSQKGKKQSVLPSILLVKLNHLQAFVTTAVFPFAFPNSSSSSSSSASTTSTTTSSTTCWVPHGQIQKWSNWLDEEGGERKKERKQERLKGHVEKHNTTQHIQLPQLLLQFSTGQTGWVCIGCLHFLTHSFTQMNGTRTQEARWARQVENTCSEGSNSLTSHSKGIRIRSSRSDVRVLPQNRRDLSPANWWCWSDDSDDLSGRDISTRLPFRSPLPPPLAATGSEQSWTTTPWTSRSPVER